MKKAFHKLSALTAGLILASTASGQLQEFETDFEDYLLAVDPDPSETEFLRPFDIQLKGWQAFIFVTDSNGVERFPGTVIAPPNGGPAYSAIANDEQGPSQGTRYLNAYNDYNCCSSTPGANDWGHFAVTDVVEVSLFRNQTIGADDIGKIYRFSFDHKRPSPDNDPETAVGVDGKGGIASAFIKTIDDSGNQTNNLSSDMTNISQTDWGRTEILIQLDDPALVGQSLQFGFSSTASDFANTGVYYDNLVFEEYTFQVPVPHFAILGLGALLAGIYSARKFTAI